MQHIFISVGTQVLIGQLELVDQSLAFKDSHTPHFNLRSELRIPKLRFGPSTFSALTVHLIKSSEFMNLRFFQKYLFSHLPLSVYSVMYLPLSPTIHNFSWQEV